MPDVFKNTDNFMAIQQGWMERLKEAANASPKRLSRLCLHHNTEDVVQEMILAFCDDCLIPPNSNPGKSESLTVVEGEMLLVLFDDAGQVTQRIEMGPKETGKTFMYRLCSTGWHTMIPQTETVIVHECIQGPFEKSHKALPDWIPTEKFQLEQFLNNIQEGINA